jgi:hypothetical protein
VRGGACTGRRARRIVEEAEAIVGHALGAARQPGSVASERTMEKLATYDVVAQK